MIHTKDDLNQQNYLTQFYIRTKKWKWVLILALERKKEIPRHRTWWRHRRGYRTWTLGALYIYNYNSHLLLHLLRFRYFSSVHLKTETFDFLLLLRLLLQPTQQRSNLITMSQLTLPEFPDRYVIYIFFYYTDEKLNGCLFFFLEEIGKFNTRNWD